MVLLRVYKFAMNIDDHWGFLRAVVNANPNTIMYTDGKIAIIQVNSDVLKVPKSVVSSRGELGLMVDPVYGKVNVSETDKYWHLQPLSNGVETIDKLLFQVPFPVEEPITAEVSVTLKEKEPEPPKLEKKKRRRSSGKTSSTPLLPEKKDQAVEKTASKKRKSSQKVDKEAQKSPPAVSKPVESSTRTRRKKRCPDELKTHC